MEHRDWVLSRIETENLTGAMASIELLMRKRFAYKENGKFELKYNSDGRLITIQGPLENKDEDEKYSIYIVRDNCAK